MLVLVILLVVTNLATLGALAYLYLQPAEQQGPDATIGDAIDRAPRPPVVGGGTRRVITIEILNPIELAGTRGRIAGIAGSLVPGLTRRIVYDQTLKTLRQQLRGEQVVADVRLHTLRPVEAPRPAEPTPPARPQVYTDEVEKVDLDRIVPGPPPEPGPPGPEHPSPPGK